MNDMERLVVATVLQKRLGRLTNSHDPDSLRSALDEDAKRNYLRTGAKSYDLQIAGSKVGSYSVRVTKPKTERRLVVDDPGKLLEWACDGHRDVLAVDPDRALDWVLDTGEVPPGCSMREVTEPGRVSGTTLRIDEDAVVGMCGGSLAAAATALLGKGEDDG